MKPAQYYGYANKGPHVKSMNCKHLRLGLIPHENQWSMRMLGCHSYVNCVAVGGFLCRDNQVFPCFISPYEVITRPVRVNIPRVIYVTRRIGNVSLVTPIYLERIIYMYSPTSFCLLPEAISSLTFSVDDPLFLPLLLVYVVYSYPNSSTVDQLCTNGFLFLILQPELSPREIKYVNVYYMYCETP